MPPVEISSQTSLCPMNVHKSSGYGVNATVTGPHFWQFITKRAVYADTGSFWGPKQVDGIVDYLYVCQYCRYHDTVRRVVSYDHGMKDPLDANEEPPPRSFPVDA